MLEGCKHDHLPERSAYNKPTASGARITWIANGRMLDLDFRVLSVVSLTHVLDYVDNVFEDLKCLDVLTEVVRGSASHRWNLIGGAEAAYLGSYIVHVCFV